MRREPFESYGDCDIPPFELDTPVFDLDPVAFELPDRCCLPILRPNIPAPPSIFDCPTFEEGDITLDYATDPSEIGGSISLTRKPSSTPGDAQCAYEIDLELNLPPPDAIPPIGIPGDLSFGFNPGTITDAQLNAAGTAYEIKVDVELPQPCLEPLTIVGTRGSETVCPTEIQSWEVDMSQLGPNQAPTGSVIDTLLGLGPGQYQVHVRYETQVYSNNCLFSEGFYDVIHGGEGYAPENFDVEIDPVGGETIHVYTVEIGLENGDPVVISCERVIGDVFTLVLFNKFSELLQSDPSIPDPGPCEMLLLGYDAEADTSNPPSYISVPKLPEDPNDLDLIYFNAGTGCWDLIEAPLYPTGRLFALVMDDGVIQWREFNTNFECPESGE